MKKSLTMALTVVVASAMFLVVSCNKSDNNPAGPGDTGLTANPTSVSLLVGGAASVTISGGKAPYSVESISDSTKVLATVAGTTLSVTGRAAGTATIIVKDSAGTSKVSVPVTVASMIATPNSVTVVKGSTATVTISGGTGSYTIKTVPNTSVATAAINGATLSVTGVDAGSASVVVKDDSSPANTVTVAITVTAAASALTANPTSVTVAKGSTATVTISGGTIPYNIQTPPTSSFATAAINGSTLSITGVDAGSTSVIVNDHSSPAKTVTVTITVTAAASALTANPTSVSVAKGSTATVSISGGTIPYNIQTPPTSSFATATINGSTLSITGVDAGTTSVTVKDNSATAKTVTVAITVTTSGGGFTTAGTLSFTSGIANFTANGVYDTAATSGSGAGAMLGSSGGSNILTIYGFRVNSATSLDMTLIQFSNSAPIATGSFTYPPTTGTKFVIVSYFPAINPNDNAGTQSFYLLSTATANISAVTSSNAQGTFSGSGMYYSNGILNPSQTISITGGTFNVPVIPGGSPNRVNKKIEGIVKRIISLQKH